MGWWCDGVMGWWGEEGMPRVFHPTTPPPHHPIIFLFLLCTTILRIFGFSRKTSVWQAGAAGHRLQATGTPDDIEPPTLQPVACSQDLYSVAALTALWNLWIIILRFIISFFILASRQRLPYNGLEP